MTTANGLAQPSAANSILLVAFEVGERWWKIGCTVGLGQAPRVRTVPAGAPAAVLQEIVRAKRRFGLPLEVPVISCYEAGRVGFWLHRWLESQGVTNHVVDSSSIEVPRRARRIKTDRLDLGGLLTLLARYLIGDRRAWRVVRVPTVAEEDARHLSRALETWTQERTRLINRIKGLLANYGVRLPVDGRFADALPHVRGGDGGPLPPGAVARLTREWAHLAYVTRELRAAQAMRRPDPATRAGGQIVHLETLRAIGRTSAWVLTTEIFAWRQIRNRRELAALVGLVPGRYQSGETARDQGITRAGNVHVRRVMVQLAWAWLRHQPQSALAQWYARRFAGSPRLRRIGIVALARKLLIALWRYVEEGSVPQGALLKALGRA
jgi:transposase